MRMTPENAIICNKQCEALKNAQSPKYTIVYACCSLTSGIVFSSEVISLLYDLPLVSRNGQCIHNSYLAIC